VNGRLERLPRLVEGVHEPMAEEDMDPMVEGAHLATAGEIREAPAEEVHELLAKAILEPTKATTHRTAKVRTMTRTTDLLFSRL